MDACLKSEVFATSYFRRQHCLDCKRNHSECRIAVYKILAGQAKNKKKLTFFCFQKALLVISKHLSTRCAAVIVCHLPRRWSSSSTWYTGRCSTPGGRSSGCPRSTSPAISDWTAKHSQVLITYWVQSCSLYFVGISHFHSHLNLSCLFRFDCISKISLLYWFSGISNYIRRYFRLVHGLSPIFRLSWENIHCLLMYLQDNSKFP
jgi:hypothetical protein